MSGLTDSEGNLIGGQAYSYDPYGGQLSGPGVANPWRFGSGFLDSETGLEKFGTRYYGAANQRWTWLDPGSGAFTFRTR